jgi:hypothetical protein
MAPPIRAGLTGIAVGLIALGALASTAVHATRAATQLDSPSHLRSAQRSNAFYNCLTAQAHSLLKPDDVVYLGDPDLDRWTTVTKAIGGFADPTLHLKDATVALVLSHTSTRPGGIHGPSCDGDIFFSIRHQPGGKVLMQRGSDRP